MNGEPLPQAPRNVLKRSLARLERQGYELRTGVECEFFIVSPDGRAVADVHDSQAKPCYDQQALVRRYDLIAEICDCLLALGWRPYQNDHEDASGQFEINWAYASALVTADRQAFFKYMVKSLAERHGLRATFMPKPFDHLTGNGCHIHVSLWDRQQGTNLFHSPTDAMGLSPLGYSFIGGVLHSAEALCALTNPAVNSYRRINAPVTSSGATWSPNVISYAGNNRTHMIRIPAPGRFELRLPDGAANPYLMAAAIAETGQDGIAQRRDPGRPLDTNVYRDSPASGHVRHLPDNLLDALRALEQNEVLREGLGSAFTDSFLKLKRSQWRDYTRFVSPWEVEHTLDC
jgi:glutamine synthetase